jgi:signal transduction histidine kinase
VHYSRLAEEELARVAHIGKQTLSFYRLSAAAAGCPGRDSRQRSRVAIPPPSVEWNRRRETIPRCDGVVQGFAVELKQVFLNMIGNAVQAMPFGGRLRVRLCRSLEWSTGRRGVRFSAHDTGQGIRPEHAKRIFEPLTLPGSVFRVRIRRDAASRVSLVSSAVHRGV